MAYQVGNAMSQNVVERLLVSALPSVGIVPRGSLVDRWEPRRPGGAPVGVVTGCKYEGAAVRVFKAHPECRGLRVRDEFLAFEGAYGSFASQELGILSCVFLHGFYYRAAVLALADVLLRVLPEHFPDDAECNAAWQGQVRDGLLAAAEVAEALPPPASFPRESRCPSGVDIYRSALDDWESLLPVLRPMVRRSASRIWTQPSPRVSGSIL